jgi:hypothetical protein
MSVSSSSPIKLEALSRLQSLPLVNSALNLAADGYSRFKSYNRLLSATLSKAEQSLSFMASTAQPVIQKFEKPIHLADNIAVQGLNKLQEKVPAISKSPEEIKDGTKKLFEDGVNRIEVVRKYSTDKIQGIKDYGVNKVNGVLDLPIIRVFVNSIDTAIDLTNKTVDHYLPATANEPAESKDRSVVVRMSHLSEKMRRRMYNQFTSKWVPTVVDRINSLKSNLVSWVHRLPGWQKKTQ